MNMAAESKEHYYMATSLPETHFSQAFQKSKIVLPKWSIKICSICLTLIVL